MAISTDELFLRQALELASRGTALASPNPLVGALIVDERGRIVGSGTHLYAELKHAEILAMEQAGPLARGNTLYLNLEPCSHTGRTGPCADAIIAAGVARVVCCMEDPNPLVAGKGFEKLRAAGIEVTVGILEAEARRLNESFAQFIRTGLPFVTLKAAMSLDGKIAGPPAPTLQAADPAYPSPASSSYITGESARRRVHEMRHASDAILVGVGTVIADDPLLTDRSGLPRRRPLMRVILDSRLRLPLTVARGRNRQRRSRRLLLLCRGEQAPGTGIARRACLPGGDREQRSCDRTRAARGPSRPLPRFSQARQPRRSPACWWKAVRPSTGPACAPGWWTNSCSSTLRESSARWVPCLGLRDKTRCPRTSA